MGEVASPELVLPKPKKSEQGPSRKKVSRRDFLKAGRAIAVGGAVGIGVGIAENKTGFVRGLLGLDKKMSSTAVASTAAETQVPAVAKPEATAQPEFKPQPSDWGIEIDPRIAGVKSKDPFNRFPEEDAAILQPTIYSLPKFGWFRFVITSGSTAYYKPREGKIYIGRELVENTLRRRPYHEVFHFYDPDINTSLQGMLSAE